MGSEWMGRYRRLVSAIVVQGNEYSRQQTMKHQISGDLYLTAMEWQILEYTIEHENDSKNMNSIAESLGIPQSTFSKTIKMLCDLGLVDKYQSTRNKKNIILRPTDYAKTVYEENAERLNRNLFHSFFDILKDVDDGNIEVFTRAMESLCQNLTREGKELEELVRITKR